MSEPLLTLEARFERDLVAVRQRARQISNLLGFDEMEQTRISTAVSEIARNALTHARGGTVEFLVEDSPPALLITVSDSGPGVGNLKAILEGGPDAGTGIAAARRLMDIFEIDSTPGRGTVVVLGKRLGRRQPVPAADLAGLAREMARSSPDDPYAEIRRQNQELVRAMEALRSRQEDLERLNGELEDTNRGVVALYAELDDKALHLRRADELKTRFLSDMSHEFRTPLNAILALSRLLLDRVDGPLSDEQAKQVRFIQRSVQGLTELVNDLLDIAKVEAGRVDVKPTVTSAANLLAGLRGMFRPLAVNPAVSLVFEDPPAMPLMCTDEPKVSQILRNFISNALKFTESGEVRVSARYDSMGAAVVFSVADTGIGIAPEDHERIFQEFAQVDHPIQARVRGTGLGLPLALKLARLLGGAVALESVPGRGSTFRATIPLVYPGLRGTGDSACLPESDVTRYPVLILEDDPHEILFYEKLLKRTGFQPLAAATVEQARQLLSEIRPLALILEARPGHEEIWNFVAEIKGGAFKEVAVLLVSEQDEEERARALGADEFCRKPLSRSRLLNSLRRWAGQTPPETVLIIDDEEVSRYLLREMLADTRYHVLEAAGGAEGIRLAREHRPAAILLDLIMPGVTGYDVLAQLAEDPATRDLPVIIVTSKTLDESEMQSLSSRASAVLSKHSRSRQEAIEAMRDALAKAGTTPRRAAQETRGGR